MQRMELNNCRFFFLKNSIAHVCKLKGKRVLCKCTKFQKGKTSQKYRFVKLCMRNERVIVMNENVTRSFLPSVARWAVNFLQIWDTVMAS